MAITRVYKLAKELGVKSTAIVNKCRDEGLDVKNHMSTISAGLAATIREWFTEGDNITTVEGSAKVDLKKVRIPKKKKKKKKKSTVETEKPKAEKVEKPSAPDKQKPVAGPTKKPRPAVKKTPPSETEPTEKKKKAKKKEPVKPVGPRLERPEPAELSGPKIVRIEEPEVVKPPPTSRKRKLSYDKPATEPLIYKPADLQDKTGQQKEQPRQTRRRRQRKSKHRREDSDKSTETSIPFSLKRRQKDIEERRARLDAAGGRRLRVRPARRIATRETAEISTPVRPEKVTINEPVTVKNLSAAMGVKISEIIRKLMEQQVMATANQVISPEVAQLVAIDFGSELIVQSRKTAEEQIKENFEKRKKENLTKRPVVVTMLGHVDHGKTTLLDKIRATHVTDTEAGGITQHIGAYQVTCDNKKITFLDTPGHEAFTAMRARGANMTDVVVLVVAADDGVMPQTIEAIHHAQAANVAVIVALNKCDLPGYDINKIYAQLAEHDLTPTEWSGNTDVVKTSAVTGEGIDDLLEHLSYTAELLELKADNTIPATGWVVEAEMSSQKGAVAIFLIKEGSLKKGDVILAGTAYGKVKTLKTSLGKNLKETVSSMPVEITGLSDVPQAGDKFFVLDDINKAKAAAQENLMLARENTLTKRNRITLDNLFSQIEAGSVKELNLIIRADVQGSVDTLIEYLSELSTEEIKIKILHAAPGGITEGDVVLAEASSAIIIGFNVVGNEHVRKLAESKGVDIRLYTVIYHITEELKKSMVGLLEPEEKQEIVGRATVRQTFKVSRIGTIAGCYVNDGFVRKNAKMRLIRDDIVVNEDLSIESLKHFKDDANEVKTGFECGIKVAKYDDVKRGDVFEFYQLVKVARTL